MSVATCPSLRWWLYVLTHVGGSVFSIIVRHSLPLRFRFLSPCASFVILFIFSSIVGVGSIFIFVQVLLYREGYHWQEGNKCIKKIWLQTNIPTKRMQQQDEEWPQICLSCRCSPTGAEASGLARNETESALLENRGWVKCVYTEELSLSPPRSSEAEAGLKGAAITLEPLPNFGDSFLSDSW